MSSVALSFLILLSPLALALPSKAKPSLLRIRVQKGQSEVGLRGVSLNVHSGSVEWTTNGLSELHITWSKGAFRLKESNSDLTAKLKGEELQVRGAFLQWNGKRVTDEVRIFKRSNGRMDVVVALPIEEYLAGVIPSEMPLNWPAEALKAQAVAARSFALRMAATRRSKSFDLDSTVYDQVHRFAEDLALHPEKQDKLKKVITETSGQVLRDERDRILKAFYSADCGCNSEDPKYVWGEVSSFTAVRDPTCGKRKIKEWQYVIQRKDLRARLLSFFKLPADAVMKTLQIGQRSPSGRVSSVVAVIEDGGNSVNNMLSAQDFRRVVGFEKIRSTDFSIQWLADELHIRGQGVGHGVGLCQYGARSLAQAGTKYEDILKTYYPKAKISSM